MFGCVGDRYEQRLQLEALMIRSAAPRLALGPDPQQFISQSRRLYGRGALANRGLAAWGRRVVPFPPPPIIHQPPPPPGPTNFNV